MNKRSRAAGRKSKVLELLRKLDQSKHKRESICRSCRLCGFCQAQPDTPPPA